MGVSDVYNWQRASAFECEITFTYNLYSDSCKSRVLLIAVEVQVMTESSLAQRVIITIFFVWEILKQASININYCDTS